RTTRAWYGAMPYSTSSSQSPDDSSPPLDGVGLSARPTASRRRSTGSRAQSEVVDPAPQLRIDLRDQSLHWLRPGASERLLELPQQGRARLALRHVLRPPAPPQRADAPEVKAQESEALPPTQIHDPTLLLVHLHLEFGEFLSKPPSDRLHQPVLPTIVVHEDHQVIRVAHVLHVGVRPVSRDRFGSLQHGIDLREIDVAEERRNHAALGNPALPGGFQHQLQQV